MQTPQRRFGIWDHATISGLWHVELKEQRDIDFNSIKIRTSDLVMVGCADLVSIPASNVNWFGFGHALAKPFVLLSPESYARVRLGDDSNASAANVPCRLQDDDSDPCTIAEVADNTLHDATTSIDNNSTMTTNSNRATNNKQPLHIFFLLQCIRFENLICLMK